MRIISGEKKGRKIFSPEGKNIRPTHDMVREAIFGTLQFEIPGKRILDLFAGTGAMGLEALSRGAGFVAFCDNSERAVKIIKENIKLLLYEDKTKIIKNNFISAIKTFKNDVKFDIVFIDPPYASNYYFQTLDNLINNNILNDGAKIILESDLPIEYDNEHMKIVKHKKFGKVFITFLEYIE